MNPLERLWGAAFEYAAQRLAGFADGDDVAAGFASMVVKEHRSYNLGEPFPDFQGALGNALERYAPHLVAAL